MTGVRKLDPDERNRLGGLIVGFVLGVLSLFVVSLAVELGTKRGLGPDHWLLWTLRIMFILLVMIVATVTVYSGRLRSARPQAKP